MKRPQFHLNLGEHGDRVALRCGDARCSFRELDRRSDQLGQALRRRGLAVGDTLAVQCRNGIAFVEAVLAAERAGLRAVPIAATSKPHDLAIALERCEARAIVTNMPEMVDAMKLPPSLAARFCIDAPAAAGFEDYDRALGDESGEALGVFARGGMMPLSSGTTGEPKLVCRPPGYTPPFLRELLSVLAFDPARDLALVPTPLAGTGVYGLGLSLALKSGVAVIIGDILTYDQVDPEDVLRLIEREEFTHLYLPMFVMRQLVMRPEDFRRRYDLSSLKAVLHGGSTCPPRFKKAAIDWFGPILTEYYAGAEGGGTIITSPEWLEHQGSIGKPLPGRVRLLGADLAEVPPGATGRIYIHAGKGRHFTYFRNAEATRRAYCGDYFTLGDLGHLDGDGYLYLDGREAEVIDFIGYKVSPLEIDEILARHPAVRQGAAFGVPHDIYGEAVCVAVALTAGQRPSPELRDELLAWCRGRLALYKCPHALVFVDEIPGFAAGKLNRRRLRALVATDPACGLPRRAMADASIPTAG